MQDTFVYDEGELVVNANDPPDSKKHNPININENKDLRKFLIKGTVLIHS